MKKILFIISTFLILSCGDDDATPTPTGCQMKVLQMSSSSDPADYAITYGVSLEESVTTMVSQDVYNFYMSRSNAGNECWIGEVTQ